MRAAYLGALSVAAVVISGTAVAASATAPAEVVSAVTRSLRIDDQKDAQSMACGPFPRGERMQWYCTWRTYNHNSFGEIWGAVATEVAPRRWLVTGAARAAQNRDVIIRSASADNGGATTLEACVRKGGGVETAGGKTACILR